MNAMVLAAGFGTRLGELGRRVPKVLIEVGGRPLLERHLVALERLGVARVVVNAHHLAAQVQAFVDRYAGPLELVCVSEPTLLGTAGAVRNALVLLGRQPFLVVYGDVLVQESLEPLVDAHRARRPAATLAVHEARGAEGKGIVETDMDGCITRFAEKDVAGEGPFLVNSGIYVLCPELVEPLPEGVALDFGHDVFPHMLAAGRTLAAYRLSRPVIDVGTPTGLALARDQAAVS
jgi:NDP-sugar pyrophosphorylase family protein